MLRRCIAARLHVGGHRAPGAKRRNPSANRPHRSCRLEIVRGSGLETRNDVSRPDQLVAGIAELQASDRFFRLQKLLGLPLFDVPAFKRTKEQRPDPDGNERASSDRLWPAIEAYA